MKHVRTVLLVTVAMLPTAGLQAQGTPDYSKVTVTTTRLGNTFATLNGQGGTTGVLFGPDGVLVIDTQFAPLTDKLLAAIRGLTPQPIRYVVNSHVHNDHTGGNANFAKAGATIIAREELRARLANPTAAAGQPAPAVAPESLPRVTYRDRLTLYMNGETVQLVAIPRAHTDGDTLVSFPGLDVIMTGDFYRSVQYPNIDRTNGGTLQGLLDGLGTVIGRAGPATKIIPGHGPTVDRSAVVAHRDLVLVVRDRIATLLSQGKSEDEVVAARVTADLDSRVQESDTTRERFVRQVYQELKSAR